MFETERLRVRRWRVDDTEGAYRMYGDPEVVRYIGNHLWESAQAARKILAGIVAQPAAEPAGMGWFPLLTRTSSELVGAVIIRPLPSSPETSGQDAQRSDTEIGLHLARCFWGQGYATEAGFGLLRWGFVDLGLPQLHAIVDVSNSASHAVVRRLGMNEQGRTEAYNSRMMQHYTLSREEWRTRSAT